MRWIDLIRSALHSVNHRKHFCAKTSARVNHPMGRDQPRGACAGCPVPSIPRQSPPGLGLLSAPGETSPGAVQGVHGHRLPSKSHSEALIGQCNYNSNKIPQSQPLFSVIEDISHRRVAFFFFFFLSVAALNQTSD